MLELYVLESCPYCKKVIKHFDEKGVKYTIHDVSNKLEFDNLMALGGEAQVPFLYDPDNDVKLYESNKIIEYKG